MIEWLLFLAIFVLIIILWRVTSQKSFKCNSSGSGMGETG